MAAQASSSGALTVAPSRAADRRAGDPDVGDGGDLSGEGDENVVVKREDLRFGVVLSTVGHALRGGPGSAGVGDEIIQRAERRSNGIDVP